MLFTAKFPEANSLNTYLISEITSFKSVCMEVEAAIRSAISSCESVCGIGECKSPSASCFSRSAHSVNGSPISVDNRRVITVAMASVMISKIIVITILRISVPKKSLKGALIAILQPPVPSIVVYADILLTPSYVYFPKPFSPFTIFFSNAAIFFKEESVLASSIRFSSFVTLSTSWCAMVLPLLLKI